MPSMNGLELLGKMKKINPKVKRILISAFEIEDELFNNCQCVHKRLQKPILMTDLIKEVQNIIGRVEIKQLNRLTR